MALLLWVIELRFLVSILIGIESEGTRCNRRVLKHFAMDDAVEIFRLRTEIVRVSGVVEAVVALFQRIRRWGALSSMEFFIRGGVTIGRARSRPAAGGLLHADHIPSSCPFPQQLNR